MSLALLKMFLSRKIHMRNIFVHVYLKKYLCILFLSTIILEKKKF